MDSVVLVKEVFDLSVWVETEARTLRLDPADLVPAPNPSDLAGLSMAVALGAGSTTALLLGPAESERTLRKCLDYGADRAIHLVCPDLDQLESHQVAGLLAGAIRGLDLKCDLLFSGHDPSGSGLAGGQIGAQVAAELGLAQLSRVLSLKPAKNLERIAAECALDLGDRVVVEAGPPLHLSLDLEAGPMAYPALEVSLAGLERPVERVELAELGLDPGSLAPRTQRLGLAWPRPRPKKVFTPASSLSAAERIRQVMGGGVAKKESELLQGEPGELAGRIIDFLTQRRLLGSERPDTEPD